MNKNKKQIAITTFKLNITGRLKIMVTIIINITKKMLAKGHKHIDVLSTKITAICTYSAAIIIFYM